MKSALTVLLLAILVPGTLVAQTSRPQVRNARLRQAQAMIESDRPDLALGILGPLLEEDAGSVLVRILLAEAHYAREDLATAVTHFETALAAAPERMGQVYHLGLAYQKLDRLDDAERVFEALRRETKTKIRAKGAFGLGLNRALQGRNEAAEALYEEAITLDPDSPLPRYRRAVLMLQREDHAAAEPELRFVLARRPTHHGAAYNLALLLSRTDRRAEGEAMPARYEKILAGKERISALKTQVWEKGASLQLFRDLGNAHRELQDFDAAIRWFRQGLRLAPQDAATALDLARTQHQGGNDDTAVLIYGDLLKRKPPVKEALEPLCKILEAQGKKGEADGWREKLGSSPDFEKTDHGGRTETDG